MSHRDQSEQNYGSAHSQSRTDRHPAPQDPSDPLRPPSSDRQLHRDSPTRHDVEFYVRKVNRYEVEIGRLEHELSVARFKLSKAEDFEVKYDAIFQDRQRSVADYLATREELDETQRALAVSENERERLKLEVKNLQNEAENHRQGKEEQRARKEELREKTESQGVEQREALRA